MSNIKGHKFKIGDTVVLNDLFYEEMKKFPEYLDSFPNKDTELIIIKHQYTFSYILKVSVGYGYSTLPVVEKYLTKINKSNFISAGEFSV